MKRLISFLFVLILAFSLLLAGCSAQNADSVKGEAAQDPSVFEENDTGFSENAATQSGVAADSLSGAALPDTGGRKVIFSSSFSVETKNFSVSSTALETLIKKYNAYIESSNVHTGEGARSKTRTASYTLRVPVEQYNALLGECGTLGTVTTRSDNNQDVTDSYYDVETRLSTLKTKEERLLTLLAQADKLTDIISLNDALEEAQYEIESLTGTLRKYDSLISYATVHITLSEVSEITETPAANATLGERISTAFMTSLKGVWAFMQGFLIFLIAALPVLVPLAVLAGIVLLIVFGIRRRNRRIRAARQQTVEPS